MGRSARISVAVAVLLCAAVGCGPDEAADDRGQAPSEDDAGSAESSPFTVGQVPEGFVVRAAGRGVFEPEWSSDSSGSTEPYVVLSPDGTADHPDLVIVSITGYQGYQGGLDQAGGWSEVTETVEVGGEEARFTPAVDDSWADLVVAQGERDLAIRVTSPDATLDELAAVVPFVEVPDDTTRPPSIPDPPDGLQVIGAVDAHAILAGRPYIDRRSDAGPGPATGHGVGWRRGDAAGADELVVMTLPGRAVDLPALLVGYRQAWRMDDQLFTARLVDDHAVFEEVQPPDAGLGETRPYLTRSLWLPTPGGDLVVVAGAGLDPPPFADLLALARSVTPTDDATWDAFVLDARGGPGLHADPGRTELARGDVGDGRQWLVQDQSPGEGNMGIGSPDDPGWSVDPCLKISDGTRECPAGEGASIDTWHATGRGDTTGVSYVMVATTRPEADALRVTTDRVVTTVALVAIPGTDQRAGVVVGEDYRLGTCADDAPPTGPRTIEIVDAAGAPLTCPP